MKFDLGQLYQQYQALILWLAGGLVTAIGGAIVVAYRYGRHRSADTISSYESRIDGFKEYVARLEGTLATATVSTARDTRPVARLTNEELRLTALQLASQLMMIKRAVEFPQAWFYFSHPSEGSSPDEVAAFQAQMQHDRAELEANARAGYRRIQSDVLEVRSELLNRLPASMRQGRAPAADMVYFEPTNHHPSPYHHMAEELQGLAGVLPP